jgi:hypothetical protein
LLVIMKLDPNHGEKSAAGMFNNEILIVEVFPIN